LAEVRGKADEILGNPDFSDPQFVRSLVTFLRDSFSVLCAERVATPRSGERKKKRPVRDRIKASREGYSDDVLKAWRVS
jgi:hypothetical protein